MHGSPASASRTACPQVRLKFSLGKVQPGSKISIKSKGNDAELPMDCESWNQVIPGWQEP